MPQLEPCPDCRALLPPLDGPTHRYIGASSACWTLYTNLHNGGEPPLVPSPYNNLLVDAYAAQHPGVPSDQAIQSVAVHTLVLYGVFEQGVALEQALWLRLRPLREQKSSKRGRFHWLTPPSFAGSITIADIVALSTPAARSQKVEAYVKQVWSFWAEQHHAVIAAWYQAYVLPDLL